LLSDESEELNHVSEEPSGRSVDQALGSTTFDTDTLKNGLSIKAEVPKKDTADTGSLLDDSLASSNSEESEHTSKFPNEQSGDADTSTNPAALTGIVVAGCLLGSVCLLGYVVYKRGRKDDQVDDGRSYVSDSTFGDGNSYTSGNTVEIENDRGSGSGMPEQTRSLGRYSGSNSSLKGSLKKVREIRPESSISLCAPPPVAPVIHRQHDSGFTNMNLVIDVDEEGIESTQNDEEYLPSKPIQQSWYTNISPQLLNVSHNFPKGAPVIAPMTVQGEAQKQNDNEKSVAPHLHGTQADTHKPAAPTARIQDYSQQQIYHQKLKAAEHFVKPGHLSIGTILSDSTVEDDLDERRAMSLSAIITSMKQVDS
jgi:hypothetical protein